MSTISEPQFKGAVLNSTLTTNLLEAATGTRIKIDHITISNGSTAGTITLGRYDLSATTTFFIFNATPIAANNASSGNLSPFELNNFYLEEGDQLRGGAATTTDAHISIDYYVITL